MSEGSERVAVKTYVPAHQRETWRAHAEELNMSLSEFVRTMVQAGRRGFEVEPVAADRPTRGTTEEAGSPDATPGVDGLEGLILDTLAEEGAADWDRLVEAATGDVEARLDETLDRLQEGNEIRYSGREGGYVAA